MKRVTETDIRVLRSRAGRTPKPKSKVGIDGMVQLTGNEFVCTEDSLDILTYAGQCNDSFFSFRKQADRSARYYKGEQWGDPVEVKNCFGCTETITEEDYIKSQGRPALKHNLIRPIVRNVLGQYRDSPYKSIVYSSEEGGQLAADQMSVKLNDVLAYNDSWERDAREYESFLVTGAAIFNTGFAFDPVVRQPMPYFEAIDYHRYFQNPDAVDVAGKDVWFCGDFVDIPLDKVKSMYAHSAAQERALEDIYHHESYMLPTMYDSFVQANPAAKSFLGGPADGNCRVVRVCRMEGFWDLTVHDYADASYEVYSTREFPDKEKEIKEEIARRMKMAEDNEFDYDDIKIVYEKKFVQRWVYYHLSPWGHILLQAENPYQHNGPGYVVKFYPLFQGQAYGMVYDLIDQQRMINRMLINLDFAMSASQQGVLIVDEASLTDDFDLEDVAEEWVKYRGVIKLKLKDGVHAPTQLAGHQVNIGQFEMVNLMMKLMMDISGVQGAMQGKAPASGTPASLYSQEVNNSQINVLDYAESFAWFVEQRDYKMIQIIQQFMGDSYSPAPDGASEEAKRYNAAEVRKYKLMNRIRRSMDVSVVRLFHEQLIANLLLGGASTIQQYAQMGVPFGQDLLAKLNQAQSQLQAGQGVSQQQIADIQASLPSVDPAMMASTQQFAQR